MVKTFSGTLPFTSRADIHVHSKYSDRPSEWLLRRIGSAECYIEPLDVYNNAKAKGMDFVTIADHNKIDGALEIAHLSDTFISTELTTYFPENGAKIHVLALGITEEQFNSLERIRKDIYELREFLIEEDIIYSIAHPLFSPNGLFTVEQVEKLLVLFNRFELVNGARGQEAMTVLQALTENLDEELLNNLAEKHNITPHGICPHKKVFTGGSDDHSGRHTATAYTVTSQAADVETFLGHLRDGRHEPAGQCGDSIRMAHSLYYIAYDFYKSRLLSISGNSGTGNLMGQLFQRLLEPTGQAQNRDIVRQRPKGRVRGWVWKRKKKQLSETEQLLVEELLPLFQKDESSAAVRKHELDPATSAFETSCSLVHHVSYAFGRRFIEKLSSGDLIKSLEAVTALGPVGAAIAPYLTAFKTQHQNYPFLKEVGARFNIPSSRTVAPKAWFTDTIHDVNGVAHTVKMLAKHAEKSNVPIELLTSTSEPSEGIYNLHNFTPVGEFNIPEYPSQNISFPPFLAIIEYIERQGFNDIIVSTPGPMGLIGLAAAKLLNLYSIGIYHTDFPNYVSTLTDDVNMGEMTSKCIYWFFNQFDVVLAPSEYYRRELIDNGLKDEKVKVMRRGIDLEEFKPDLKDRHYWQKHGGREATTFLYVGRVSKEKNIDWIVEAFSNLLETDDQLQLAIVGDGPQLEEIRHRTKDTPQILTTGYLNGPDLVTAYASSDVFVFPSTSDTFGNAVLEAQACGVPAIVSDSGGPQEIVNRNNSGVILHLEHFNGSVDKLTGAMQKLAVEPSLRSELGQKALRTASEWSWESVLASLTSAFS